MSDSIPIYLARHGETFWNKEKKLQGHLDSELTSNGHNQARMVANKFAALGVKTVISSTLPRAVNTAKVYTVKHMLPLITDARLTERDFGAWQGQFMKSLQHEANYRSVFYRLTSISPPQGESSIAAAHRFTQGLTEQIMSLTKHAQRANNCQLPIGVVTHGEILRCFLAGLDEQWRNFDKQASEIFVNGGITPLRFNQHTKEFFLC